VDKFCNIYLEDTITGEAVMIGTFPEGSYFTTTENADRWKAKWLPDYEVFVHDSGRESRPIQTGWKCSRCGKSTLEKTDWCSCGANMNGHRKISKEFEELLDTL
jgi:hypothetical protein